MEQELFSWKSREERPGCVSFYEVILNQSIGDYQSGTEFSKAVIRTWEKSTCLELLQWFDNDLRIIAVFKIHYKIGKQIPLKM